MKRIEKLEKYEHLLFMLSFMPLAIFFPFPCDLIPLAIQIIALYLYYKIN